MRILLYSPDNGVTKNFMPHLWMFLLRSLTPPEHEVELIDANARPMTAEELQAHVKENDIGLVGIGSMTRMVARAYKMADAVRAIGVPVVMGGPHVTEMAREALGHDGGTRHADAVAIGEADETWPQIIADAEKGQLEEIYEPERKPPLEGYPGIPWESLDLDQFDLVPKLLSSRLAKLGTGWGKFRMIPIETGRGCPYGCEFCTVTGFFGESIRFRTDESVVDEMLRLKKRMRAERGQFAVFFVDDNFAINVKRTKSLLRAIIAADAQLPFVAQVSANLLRDEELVDLIAQAEGRWIFIGMESLDPANMKDVNKQFSRPEEYQGVLQRLARRDIYAITAFIFGLDNDKDGLAERTMETVRTWPPGLPVFSALTPYPGTPMYDRFKAEGRLTRPEHWLEFAPFHMAHIPRGIAVENVQGEIRKAWELAYSADEIGRAIDSISDRHFGFHIAHLIARLCFRGIYFPQMGKLAWAKVIFQNRRTITAIAGQALRAWWRSRRARGALADPA